MLEEQSEVDCATYWVKEDMRGDDRFSEGAVDSALSDLVSGEYRCLELVGLSLGSLEQMSRLS